MPALNTNNFLLWFVAFPQAGSDLTKALLETAPASKSGTDSTTRPSSSNPLTPGKA